MKVYTIAEKNSVCYGHGDSGDELQICKTGGYGTGKFPPVFTTVSAAEQWMQGNLALAVKHVVVDLELHGVD